MAVAPTVDNTTSKDQGGGLSASLLLTLALLSAIAPFATDLYLPAFPAMVGDLSTTATGVQLSLTTFLIGAGVGQVVFGPISDRIGRRVPLIVGALLFVVASIGAATAATISLLVVMRLAQGLFGAAGMVIGRAVISDRAHGEGAARAFSLMMIVGGIAPIIAPFLGSALADTIGWRGLLWVVVGIGIAAVLAVVVVVRESRPREVIAAERARAQKGSLHDLSNRRFISNAVAFACAFATMMAYISASPFLYQDLMGMTTLQYGLAFALNALVLAVVSGVSVKLTYRFSIQVLTRTGLGINLASITVLVLLVLLDAPVLLLTIPILVAVGALGLVLGNTTALALESIPRPSTGSASAMIGLLQFLLAGLVSPLVSIGGANSALPMALVMFVASVAAATVWGFGAGRRHHNGAANAAQVVGERLGQLPEPVGALD